MTLSFDRFTFESDDAEALSWLVSQDSIWEGMRIDGKEQHEVAMQDWPGSYVSIARDKGEAVGFMVFLWRGIGLYELHVGFLDEARGCAVPRLMKDAVDSLFFKTDAVELFVHCPDWNPVVEKLAQFFCARLLVRNSSYAMRDGKMQGAIIHTMTLSEWIFQHINEFGTEGDGLIEKMRMVAMEMAKWNPDKAGRLYNLFAGYVGQPGVHVAAIPEGAVLTFADLRILISRGTIAAREDLKCR